MPWHRKLPFISEMLLLNVFGNLSVSSNVSFYFMKGLEVVSPVHCTWCGFFVFLGVGLAFLFWFCCFLGFF